LKIIRKGATTQHKELVAEDERIDKKLKLMINASGLNVSNYFEGRAEKSHKHSGREGIMARKSSAAHCNIKYSHLWRKGYYRHTKFQLEYKQRNTGLQV